MQPAYLPWLGYIQRTMHVDAHIILDHVKIDLHSKTKFTNRNKILRANGPVWLTIPLSRKDSGDMRINAIRIASEERWARKHWMTLEQGYAKAPFFPLYADFFNNFYAREHDFLATSLGKSTDYLLQAFGCASKVITSSSLNVSGLKDELILNICRECNADTYISGPFGRDYLRLNAFKKAGIKVLFHDFTPFVYPQTLPGFVPFLSSVDLLFNVPPEQAHGLLSSSIHLAEH